MLDRCNLLALLDMLNHNPIQLCKAVSLLVLLLANVLLGIGVLSNKNMTEHLDMDKENLKFKETAPILSSMVTQCAPHFEGIAVLNNELTNISLSQFAGKYVVLLFYALDFSSVCPSEVTAYSDRLAEFVKLNTVVIACSVDSPYSHLTWLQMPQKASGLGKIKIPLLSDLTHKISQDYGVYMPSLGHSLRAQFIIDGKGIIRQTTINDLFVARSVDETLRLVKACRYVDRTGNNCPANMPIPPERQRKYQATSGIPF